MNASLVARATAYALSAGAHVAIMVVTFGHPAAAKQGSDATELTVETETPVDVVQEPAPEPEPVANNVKTAGTPAPPTHTHDYPVPFDHDAHPHDPNLVHMPLAPHDHDDDHDHDHDVVQAPAPVAHFTMHLTTGGPAAAANPAPGTNAAATGNGGEGGNAAPLPEAAVSVPARLVGSVTPAYPPSARQNEIEADVALEIIVSKDGQVVDARVTKPAGYGFDDAAVRAVRAARFMPALHDGHAVPVRMRWSVAFRLR